MIITDKHNTFIRFFGFDAFYGFGLFLLNMLIRSLILALPLMLLWNWLVPSIFGLTAISFWQSLGLMALSTLLLRTNVNIETNKRNK